ncbi:hypothetical protein LJC36_06070 [Desulfovibrio sp. OttesenSCG-928-C14]|nr:hypothetical protein [Desulfovibrio sp. OttesenSCG-928-C14]
MPAATEDLKVTPYMDLELLLTNSQETRIDGKIMDKLAESWGRWAAHLKAKRIQAGSESYLAVWLDESVEEQVDEIWDDAPSEAFLYNALAQTMCMSAIYDLLPEVADSGCAPAPRPTLDLKTALEELDLRDPDEENPGLGLARRYAVTTYYPFRGGCEVCDLRAECPKLKGSGEDYSVVLPGYEPE